MRLVAALFALGLVQSETAPADAQPAAPGAVPEDVLPAGEPSLAAILAPALTRCWTPPEDAVQVTVAMSMGRDGRPEPGTFRLLSPRPGSGPADAAFDAARRAILRCAARGLDLPVEKYDRWKQIEITFNPEKT